MSITGVARRRQRSCLPRIDVATVTLRSLGRSAAVVAALLVLCLCLPAVSVAAGGAAKDGRSSGELLSIGVGYGSQGGAQAVRELQVRLRTVGYEPGPIDGLFGPMTEGAVRSFQRAHGLAADGVVGPRTDSALRGAGVQAVSASVRVIQRQLRVLGYETGPIDGAYGPLTEAAVERFQRDQGLTVDGVPGAQTVARLEATRAEVVPEPVDRPAGPGPGNADGSARGGALSERPQPHTFSHAEARAGADSSSPVLRPGYLALLAALALVVLLSVVRARRRSKRTPAPAPKPQPAATGGGGVRFNAGLACAVLLGGLVVGAAGGALFAAQSSPDDGAAATVESLPSRGGEPERPSASQPKRREHRPVTRARAAAAPARPAATPAPAASAVPTSAPTLQETPVLGAAEAVAAATTRRAERPGASATEPELVAAKIARAPRDDPSGFAREDKLAGESPEAGAAGSRR
jgi:peptidoglycan hydrolase-like protein with peptidoglycan-binding domain